MWLLFFLSVLWFLRRRRVPTPASLASLRADQTFDSREVTWGSRAEPTQGASHGNLPAGRATGRSTDEARMELSFRSSSVPRVPQWKSDVRRTSLARRYQPLGLAILHSNNQPKS